MPKKTIILITLILFFFVGCTQSNDSNNQDTNNSDSNTIGTQNGNQIDLDKCKTVSDCDDKDISTHDFCSGTPKKCLYVKKTECGADGYCPPNCNSTNDSDCKETKTCAELEGELCDVSDGYCQGTSLNASDSDNENKISCCSIKCWQNPEKKTCAELSGELCDDDKTCQAPLSGALEAECCNKGFCIFTYLVDCETEADCPNDFKCFNNDCVLKNCEELNGDICSQNESCTSSWLQENFIHRCCASPCVPNQIDPCDGVNCQSNQKCVNGSCVLKTCAELSGSVCGTEETCDGTISVSSDQTSCCVGTCQGTDSCGGTCSPYEDCLGGYCYPKICNEITGAEQCGWWQYCNGEYIEEVYTCCLGTCEYGTMSHEEECITKCQEKGYGTGECSTPTNELCVYSDPNAISSYTEPLCSYSFPVDDSIHGPNWSSPFVCCCS